MGDDLETIVSKKVALSQLLRRLAYSNRCTFVDTGELIPLGRQWEDLWETKDWIHFTAAGSQRFGRALADTLRPHPVRDRPSLARDRRGCRWWHLGAVD